MTFEAQTSAGAHEFYGQVPVFRALEMLDMLSDWLAWIKDRQGRLMFANATFLEQYGLKDLSEAVGKTDYDLSPAVIARQFIEDDRQVIQGKIVRNRLELNVPRSGEVCWYLTNKQPLRDAEGKIIGSYGMTQRLEKANMPISAVEQLQVAVDYIRSHFAEDIQIGELAEVSCISVSALERRFKKHLHKSPKQFINEIRLEHAARMLTTGNEAIANIASASGFADPNYFTRLFNRYFGTTPREFRQIAQKD